MSQSASTVIETLPTSFNGAPLPNDWRLARLDEVCEFLDWRRIPVNNTERLKRITGKNPSELYPYYGANGQTGWIDDYLFDEPLILLAEDGGNFGSKVKPIAYRVSGRYWVNNHAHVLRPKDSIIDFDFCLHALRIRPDVAEMVSGSTRAKLNQEIASKIPVPLPPRNEQKRIAAILNEQMAAVERARAAAEAQLEAAKSLYSLYLRFVFDSDEAQRWKKKRLGDISIVGPDNGAFKKRHEFGTGVPIVNVLDLFRSLKLDLHKVERVNASLNEQSRYAIASGDLFFCRSSLKREGVGWCCYVEEVNEPAIFECHVMRVRLDPESALPDFVAHYWQHPAVREEVISSAKTATMTTMNQSDLARVAIPLPTINEQRRVAATLSEKLKETERIVSFIQNQLNEINKLPAALLRQAFTGNL